MTQPASLAVVSAALAVGLLIASKDTKGGLSSTLTISGSGPAALAALVGAMTALLGGHIQVFTGDAAETHQQMKAGSKVRILAVMADKRLTGELSTVPTAKEQGADIEWPIIRGFYLGPKVSDADYKVWVDTFTKMMTSPAYEKLRTERGLYPFSMTGPDFDAYVKKQVTFYRKLAEDFGLAVTK